MNKVTSKKVWLSVKYTAVTLLLLLIFSVNLPYTSAQTIVSDYYQPVKINGTLLDDYAAFDDGVITVRC